MNVIASMAAVVLALVYMARMENLQYSKHGFSFVLQQASSAAVCICCAVDIFERGLSALAGTAIFMAGMYLIRSRKTYAGEITKPMDLPELDMHDLTNVAGRGDR